MGKSFHSTMPDYNNLLIVDGFNLAFRYKHANKTDWAAEYLQTVMSFANSYGAKNVVVLSDGGSKFREEIFPGYKSGRKELRKDQTQEEADKFAEFMEDWKMAFQLCGTQYTTIRYNGVEADDIAAYLTIRDDVLANFEHIWLLSTDKDWDLLLSDKISRFSYRTRKDITMDNWYDHYSYEPEEHISIKILQGDKSDSIPGVTGIGEKRAATLVKEYGSAFDIYCKLPIQDKRVFMQNLNNFKDQIITNYKLMSLVDYCEEAIGEENIDDLESKIQEIL